MNNTDLYTIGIIVAPHGVRGDVRIIPETDFPERFLDMDTCYIDGKEYHISSARFHKQYVLVKFEEISDRNGVEKLLKKEIQVTRDGLMPLPEGRYYICDLIGLEVYNEEGLLLGKLKDVLRTGANDVYIIEKEGEPDLLLPNIESVIISIDIEEGKIIANPPEWI